MGSAASNDRGLAADGTGTPTPSSSVAKELGGIRGLDIGPDGVYLGYGNALQKLLGRVTGVDNTRCQEAC